MKRRTTKLIAICAIVAALAGSNVVKKGKPTLEELDARLERQDQKLAEQQHRLEAQQEKLMEYEDALNRLRAERTLERQEFGTRRAGGTPQARPADVSSAGLARGAADSTVAQAQPSGAEAPPAPVGQPPQPATKPPEVAPLTAVQTVLTPRGKFVLEPSLQYAHSTNTRVDLVGFTIIPAITIGLINIESVNRDLWIAALTGRYGLTERLELESKVPWVYRTDSTRTRPTNVPSMSESVFDTSGKGLGDIELAARYQLTERPPFFIGFLRYKPHTGKGPFDVPIETPQTGVTIQSKLPTGTGFNTLQVGGTGLVPSDPAVFFGGLSYIWNIGRNIGTLDPNGNPIGYYKPGDGVDLNFGMGLAINDRASFSVGYDHTTFFRDRANGATVATAQTRELGTLLFGVSYKLTPRMNFNLTLGAGVTRDAPDVQISARLPYTF